MDVLMCYIIMKFSAWVIKQQNSKWSQHGWVMASQVTISSQKWDLRLLIDAVKKTSAEWS